MRILSHMRLRFPHLPDWLKTLLAICVACAMLSCALTLVLMGGTCTQTGKNLPQSDTGGAPVLAPEEKLAAEALRGHERPEESSYLTYAEWSIVYSSEEYAKALKSGKPSSFPYFRSSAQFWCGYRAISEATKHKYPFNIGDHVMLWVIGTSQSAEFIVKGVYENTVGRLTELFGTNTDEDRYAAAIAAEYGHFLHETPWYEFDFASAFNRLWETSSLWGPSPVRKWERKLILSVEYGIKAVYGRLIKLATKSAYGDADLEIYAVTSRIPDAVLKAEPRIRVIKHLDVPLEEYRTTTHKTTNGTLDLVLLPRYEAFTGIVQKLAATNVRFWLIAGNDEILVTVIAPEAWTTNGTPSSLFEMPILTNSGYKRVGLRIPVESLSAVIGNIQKAGMTVEHVYDY